MRASDAPLAVRDMALLRQAATNDGPLLLSTKYDRATGTRLAKTGHGIVRKTRTGKTEQRYFHLTDLGRTAVRRSLAHA